VLAFGTTDGTQGQHCVFQRRRSSVATRGTWVPVALGRPPVDTDASAHSVTALARSSWPFSASLSLGMAFVADAPADESGMQRNVSAAVMGVLHTWVEVPACFLPGQQAAGARVFLYDIAARVADDSLQSSRRKLGAAYFCSTGACLSWIWFPYSVREGEGRE